MAFPTPAQEAILHHVLEDHASALVVSGPGTGKSRIGLELARRRVGALAESSTRQILFLSFSNAAIQRLARDVGLHFTRRQRRYLRFMTFHSCAADILARYGRFVGLGPRIKVVDKLEEKLIALELALEENDTGYHEKLRELACSRGLLSFDVLIPFAVRLLEKSPTLTNIFSRSYSLVIVDEFQDTSSQQWQLVKLLGDGTQVVALADPNQIIYASMHGATQERLREFAGWKGIEPVHLPQGHHRCSNARILELADCLLNGRKCVVEGDGGVQRFPLDHRNQLRAYIALVWREIRKQAGPRDTIAVLVPSNKLAEDIAVGLRNPPAESGVSFPVYAAVARDEAAYDSVKVALAALHDHAFVLTQDSRSRLALALCALSAMWGRSSRITGESIRRICGSLEKSEHDQRSAFSQLSSRLKAPGTEHIVLCDLLRVLTELPGFQPVVKRIEAHFELKAERLPLTPMQPSLFEKCRHERSPKGLYGAEALEGRTQVLTYHKAKGREFDWVLLVVEPRHESRKPPIEESRRLYYVCATRAKRWLGILYFRDDPGRVLRPTL